MKKWMTKLHRFLFGPQIGDVYVHNDRPVNPFQPFDDHLVEIIDKKDHWVQIKHIASKYRQCSTQEWSIRNFLSRYQFLRTTE